jgi:hypothetical protein
MPLNLASPGIVVREVDLTSGRVDPTSDKVAGIVAPFAKGPVEVPTLIETEADLLNTFGEPSSTDNHYEYWYTASAYLAYGGVLRVVRSDNGGLYNGLVGTATSIKIKSDEDYVNKGYDTNIITNVTVAAKNPGTWSNGIKVAVIDGLADQTLNGLSGISPALGVGVTQAVPANTVVAGSGTTSVLDGYFKGIVTEVAAGGITSNHSVKLTHHVSAAGTVTAVDYTQGGVYRFANSGGIHFWNTNGSSLGMGTYVSSSDWFDQQSISLTGSTIKWNRLAERPGTSSYANARSGKNDEVHVIVFDDLGTISGNAGTILEKHLSLSKATDAEFSAGTSQYWRTWLQFNSTNIYGGGQPLGVTTTGFATGAGATVFTNFSDGGWDQGAKQKVFNGYGNNVLTLSGGKNYGNNTTPDTYDIDFLLMGSGAHGKEETQAIANKIIAVAGERKDTVAFVSPYRQAFISDGASTSILPSSTITDNLVSYFSAISSSSYAVFDSSYKYTYDRFADTFRYIPMNGDIAGTCARNDINNFPWFSPAGTARGSILNVVKLAYNPTQAQRDKLYTNRVNPIIFSPGAGIILFGDKTGLGRASAFDRINVRRLFIYIEKAIAAAARDVMFEFNDEITRTNFVSIVEPFLRDVQAKRGITDFVVKCDETNNTAAVIDNNEFVADIYIKPARSINFIGLTFVATRTGVSFDEVLGV